MEGRSIAVIIMRAPNNKLETHLTMIPELIRFLAVIQPGRRTPDRPTNS